jgi:hypothetical protein
MTTTVRTVQIGDKLRLSNGVIHTITTEGELGFANWLVKNGRAEVVTDDDEAR